MGYIGNMDTNLVIAVFKLFEAEGVVKVIGVRGVYCECESLAEVLATAAVLVRDFIGNLIGGILNLRAEPVGKAEFRQDGVHLSLILSGKAKDVYHVAVRAAASFPAVHNSCNLHSPLCAFRHGNGDVIWHGLGAHENPGLFAHNVQDANKRLIGALNDVYYLTAPAFVTALAFLGYGHPHGVSVKRAAGFGCLDIDVILLPLHLHKDKAFTGHMGGAHILRNYPLL